jgi:hypothetical protein
MLIEENNSDVHLCDTCKNRGNIPQCFNDDLEFGNGLGNDNIIKCKYYIKEE